MNASRQLRSLGFLRCAVGFVAILSTSTIGCALEADAPETAGEAEAGREGAGQQDDRGGELSQTRSATLALGGQLAFGISQVFDDDGSLVGYAYNAPAGSDTLQRWMISTDVAWDLLVIREYDPANNLVAIAPIEQNLAGWQQLVASQWAAFSTTPTYAVCASQIYEHGGVYNNVSWQSIPSLFPQPKLPAYHVSTGRWYVLGPQDLTDVRPVRPTSNGIAWPPGPGDLKGAYQYVLPQLYPGDGKIFQYEDIEDALDVGFFYGKGSVLDNANAEYFYMTPDYTPAGDAGLDTQLIPDIGAELSLDSDSEFALTASTAWDPGAAIAINGCVNYHQANAPAVY